MGVIVTLLLVASVAINVWLIRRRRSSPKKRRSVRSTLMEGIKNIKELATIRQSFQSVVMFRDSKSFGGFSLPGTTRKFILKYSGMVVCGSDFSRIQISERFAVNRVRMTVPRSELLDLYADMKSIKVYDQKAGLFASINLSDQNREIAKNLDEVREEALKSDILRRADENTRLVLASFAASMGMEAEVIFEGGIPEAAPAETVAEFPPVREESL